MTLSALVLAQLCAGTPAGGAPTDDPRPNAHFAHSVSASRGSVLATWLVQGRDDRGSTFQQGFARTYVSSGLTPLSNVRPLQSDLPSNAASEGSASTNAPVALQTSAGVMAVTCRSAARFSGGGSSLSCETNTFPNGGNTVTLVDVREDALIGVGRYAAAIVGASPLVAVPMCGQIGVRRIDAGDYSTRVSLVGNGGANAFHHGCARNAGGLDGLAITPAGPDQAVLVWRQNRQLFLRMVGSDEQPRGPVVPLTAPRSDVGPPAVAWVNGTTWVAFSARPNARAPYQLSLVQWPPPPPPPAPPPPPPGTSAAPSASASASPYPVPVVFATPLPVVNPSVVPSQQAGCLVVSWTEGAGHATVNRVGRICNGAFVPTSLAQLSRPGVEAGEVELTVDAVGGIIALWQEMPPGVGAELRMTRLGCQ